MMPSTVGTPVFAPSLLVSESLLVFLPSCRPEIFDKGLVWSAGMSVPRQRFLGRQGRLKQLWGGLGDLACLQKLQGLGEKLKSCLTFQGIAFQ